MATSMIPANVEEKLRLSCAEIVAAHPGLITNVWGYASFPDHSNRRCVDLMIKTKAGGDALAAYLIANADRLGLNWLIWNRRIYRHNSSRGHGWAPYTGPKPHTDHVHYELASGPYKAPSKATVRPVATGKRLVAYVVSVDELYGLDRTGGPRSKRKHLRKRGHVLKIARIATGSDGRKWGVTAYNTYYWLGGLTKKGAKA